MAHARGARFRYYSCVPAPAAAVPACAERVRGEPETMTRSRLLRTASVGLALALAGGCPVMLPQSGTGGSTETTGTSDAQTGTSTTPTQHAPVADAGEAITASSGALVVLDGTGTQDEDGDPLIFIWRQMDGTPTVTLEDAFSSRPRFFAPDVSESTTLTFELIVTDGFFADTDQVSVTINP